MLRRPALLPRPLVHACAAALILIAALVALPAATASAAPRQAKAAQAAGAPVPVLGATALRSKAGGGRVIRTLRKGTAVRPVCTASGGLARVRPDGLSRLWVRVAVGGRRGWVHDARVNSSRGALLAPLCGIPAATAPALPGVTAGRCGVTAPVTLLPPFATFGEFIAAALPGAVASWKQTYVPVSVTLAQGILETGGGKYAAMGNNYFGIKAKDRGPGLYYWGPNAVGCTFTKTREAERSGLVLTVGAFRAYSSLDQSIMDHGYLLTSNPVYAPAFRYVNQPTRFLREIARRYATDPRYATKLLSLIKRYSLGEHDLSDPNAPTTPVSLPEAPATTVPAAAATAAPAASASGGVSAR